MAGMNPQMLMQLLGAAGGQQQGQSLGPESLLAILSSLGLGKGTGAPGGGNAMGLQGASLAALLPQLLQALQQGQPQQGQMQGGAPKMQQQPQQNPALSVLQLLGMVRGGGAAGSPRQ